VAALSPVGAVGFGAPLRLGSADGLGRDPAALRDFAGAALGRRVTIVPFPSMAALRDHFDAGTVDAALMPLATPGLIFASPAVPDDGPRATLLIARAAGGGDRGIARAVADPAADAALANVAARALGGPVRSWLTLPHAHLAPNVAAGLIGAALVFGDVEPRAGFDRVPLASADARAVSPRLAVVLHDHFAETLSEVG
jgi:hypothetical protein